MTRWTLALVAALGILLGAVGMVWWRANDAIAVDDRPAVERVVRDYLLTHPEIIPEAMQRLQQRETTRAVASAGDAITRPFASAWAGNPRGDVTVVEYYDYNCGYCRASLPTIRALIAADRGVKVVFRELPILGPTSRPAAEASLAAAAQGRFARFHDALYAGGRVSNATIAAAARSAGVDLARADRGAADAEIARNMAAAGQLGLSGTPSWVIGGQLLSGALPLAELQKAVAAARGSR